VAQLAARPDSQRITLASWPEVAYFYASATPSNQQWTTSSHTRWYRYAFELTVRRYYTEQPACFDSIAGVDLNEYERQQLGSFRRSLKRVRDRMFLNHHYDALCSSTPKAAWTARRRGW
jgi:hypothetical protein